MLYHERSFLLSKLVPFVYNFLLMEIFFSMETFLRLDSQPLDDHLSQTAGVLPHVFPASRFSRLHPRLVSSALLFRLSRVRSRAVFSRPCCFFSLYFSLPFLSPCQLSRSHSDCWCIGSTLDITESDCTMTRSTRSDSSIQLAQTQSTVVHRCKNSLYYTLHGARSGSPK